MSTTKFNKTILATFAATVLSFAIVPLAHADISKCKDADGIIVYSDVSCGNAQQIDVIAETPSQSLSASTSSVQKTSSRNKQYVILSADNGPVRESSWAHRDVPASKKSLDQLTIRDARETLNASDSAIAFLRRQAIASNR